MEELLLISTMIAWVISGFAGAGWLMLKGYTMEMFGCLGVLYGGVLALIAILGPIILVIAWALPSRTDPTKEGGIKRLLKAKSDRNPPPTSGAKSVSMSNVNLRSPPERRTPLSGKNNNARSAIPPRRSKQSRSNPSVRRPKKPPTRG
jgi:hypothetical protein